MGRLRRKKFATVQNLIDGEHREAVGRSSKQVRLLGLAQNRRVGQLRQQGEAESKVASGRNDLGRVTRNSHGRRTIVRALAAY